MRALPQVARAEFLRSGRILLDPARPPLVAARARPRRARRSRLVGERYERRAGDPPPVWVSEAVVDLYGFAPGQRLELPLLGKNPSGRRRRRVARLRAPARRDPDRPRRLRRAHRRPARERRRAVARARAPRRRRRWRRCARCPAARSSTSPTPGEIRELSLRIFDRSFAVTYAMEAVAVLVGLFGLSSSLGAIVLARRREFGVLRHLGLTRAQIGAMLAAEGGLLALRRRRRRPRARARRSAWSWSTSSTGSRSTGAWSCIRRTCCCCSLVVDPDRAGGRSRPSFPGGRRWAWARCAR